MKASPERIVLIAGVAIVAVGVALFFLDVLPKEKSNIDYGPPPDLNGMMMATPFITPIVKTPPTVSAQQSTLKDDDEIIGVVVKGKARAYRLRVFASFRYHVVNDLIEGVPVTVTHCDQLNCTRVFTSDGNEPLAIQTGGFNKGMLLYIGGDFYSQHDRHPGNEKTPPFPYDVMEFEQTTWAKWRVVHPNTDVYEGDPSDKQKS